MKDSKIQWTDHTFNAWIGCTKVSPACANCYAENLGGRLQVNWGPGQARLRTGMAYWAQPKKWNRDAERTGVRQRVFTNSLADVFDNEVPDSWRDDLFDLIQSTPWLDWLILTKRIGNASKMLPSGWASLYPNASLGISVGDQDELERDAPKLISLRAKWRFISYEPALQRIDLSDTFGMWWNQTMKCWEGTGRRINTDAWGRKRIDWVIVGGESGPRARTFKPEWATDVIRQCRAAGAAPFVKQMGHLPHFSPEHGIVVLADKKGGDINEWPAEFRVREFPS